jgi:hypothetical protein
VQRRNAKEDEKSIPCSYFHHLFFCVEDKMERILWIAWFNFFGLMLKYSLGHRGGKEWVYTMQFGPRKNGRSNSSNEIRVHFLGYKNKKSRHFASKCLLMTVFYSILKQI